MATTKITDLSAYTDPVNTDVLPIVDVTSDVTKKVSIANVMKNASLGSASAPGVAFDGDPNTGIYSPGADQVAVSTGGTQRLLIDSSGVVTIAGDLTVNGTTTNINTQNLVVEDKNVVLGDVATPTDVTADGGGITLKGTTDKTINWVDATDAWTSSEHINIASGKEYRIAGTKVLDATSLGSSVLITSANITDGTIVNADINAAAAIDKTKISGTAITAADTGTVTSTMIADGTILNADVNAAAAIAGTKISPDFGSQNVTTTGTSTAASFIPSSSTAPTNGVYLPAANTVGISTGGSGRLFVDASGNVGIGTSTSGGVLRVFGATGKLIIGDSNFNYFDANTQIFRDSSANERMRLDSSGRLGVGTSTVDELLHLKGASTASTTLKVESTATAAERSSIHFFNGSVSRGRVGGSNDFDGLTLDSSTTESAAAIRFRTGGASLTTKMTLTSGGSLGIGTSSPDANSQLHIVGSGYSPLFVNTTNTGGGGATFFRSGTQALYVGTAGSSWLSGSSTADGLVRAEANLVLASNGNTRAVTIDTSQRVGIGTTSPSNTLHVSANDSTPGYLQNTGGSSSYLRFGNTASTTGYIGYVSSDLTFWTANLERARIDGSGRLLVGTSSTILNGDAVQIAANDTNCLGLFSGRNDIYGPRVDFVKSRGTAASPSNVSNGDQLGNILFYGYSGGYVTGAAIEAFVDAAVSGTEMPSRLVFSTTADGASSPTERMRITQKGMFKFSSTGTYYNATGGEHELIQGSNGDWSLRIQHNGTTTNPYGQIISYPNATPNSTGNEFLYCVDSTAVRAIIRSNGGLANYSANNANLSDRNAKKDISPAAGTWDCIKEWEIVNYRYKDQPDDADMNLGVIAQQVAESCPEVITVFEEAKDDQPEKLGIKEQQMYWMAIKALQEAQVRIEALEAEVAALKAQ